MEYNTLQKLKKSSANMFSFWCSEESYPSCNQKPENSLEHSTYFKKGSLINEELLYLGGKMRCKWEIMHLPIIIYTNATFSHNNHFILLFNILLINWICFQKQVSLYRSSSFIAQEINEINIWHLILAI